MDIAYLVIAFLLGAVALYLYMVLSGKWAEFKAAHPSEAALVESAIMFAIAWIEKQGIIGSAEKLREAVTVVNKILATNGIRTDQPALSIAISNKVAELNATGVLVHRDD